MTTIRAAAVFLALALAWAPAHAQDKTPGGPADIAFWNSVKDSRNAAELQAYLDAFPNGTFVELARIRLQQLQRQPQPAPAPPALAGSALTSPAVIREVQKRLYDLNYEITSLNGQLNDETRKAIRTWQTTAKRAVTGDMDEAQLTLLRAARIPVIWGALAYTAQGAFGTAWNKPTRQDAERDALLACRARGVQTCRVRAMAEKACGAIVLSAQQVGTKKHSTAFVSVRPTLAQAIDNARAECQRLSKQPEACSAPTTLCADGSHRQ